MPGCNCPHCGRKIIVQIEGVKIDGGSWHFDDDGKLKTYEARFPGQFIADQVVTADLERMRPAAPSTKTKVERPIRPPSKWDFGIPALFAVGTAVVVGVPATAGALLLEWAKPFLVGPAIGWLAGGALWFWRINLFDGLIMSLEERSGLDIDRDGAVGEPEPQRPQPVEVWQTERKDDGEAVTRRYQLPIDADKMRQFARFILGGGNLSRDAVTDATNLSQPDYNALLATLEERGMVGRQGNQRQLLASGRVLLGKFV